MKKFTIALVATALNGALAFNGMAQSAPCACISGPVASNAAVGSIVNSSGDVLYSGAGGYVKAQAGAKLVTGSQISVGANSSANILIGATCKLNIPANSEASILQPKGSAGDICVRVSSLTETPQEGVSTQLGAGAAAGALIGGGVTTVAVAATVAESARNTDKSPQKNATNNVNFVKDAQGNFIAVSGGTNVASQ